MRAVLGDDEPAQGNDKGSPQPLRAAPQSPEMAASPSAHGAEPATSARLLRGGGEGAASAGEWPLDDNTGFAPPAELQER